MSQLFGILPHFLIGVPLVGGVIVVIRWRFGSGLASKIYSLLMSLLFFVSMSSIAVSQMVLGSAIHIASTLIVTIIVVVSLYYVYQMIVAPIAEMSKRLKDTSIQLSSTAAQSAATATEQSSMASQISSTVEEIARNSRSSSQSAQEIVSVSASALAQSNEGQKSVQETLDIMGGINDVAQVVNLIRSLAEQSNLLALNASIEAAKAGEYGRGFNVVASEVRNLAEHSKKAAKEIATAIERTGQGQRSAERTKATIEKLSGIVEDASNRSRVIASAALEQAAGIKQINEAAISLSQSSRDTAEVTQDVEQTARNMKSISKQLMDFVGGRTTLEDRRRAP